MARPDFLGQLGHWAGAVLGTSPVDLPREKVQAKLYDWLGHQVIQDPNRREVLAYSAVGAVTGGSRTSPAVEGYVNDVLVALASPEVGLITATMVGPDVVSFRMKSRAFDSVRALADQLNAR